MGESAEVVNSREDLDISLRGIGNIQAESHHLGIRVIFVRIGGRSPQTGERIPNGVGLPENLGQIDPEILFFIKFVMLRSVAG